MKRFLAFVLLLVVCASLAPVYCASAEQIIPSLHRDRRTFIAMLYAIASVYETELFVSGVEDGRFGVSSDGRYLFVTVNSDDSITGFFCMDDATSLFSMAIGCYDTDRLGATELAISLGSITSVSKLSLLTGIGADAGLAGTERFGTILDNISSSSQTYSDELFDYSASLLENGALVFSASFR